MYGFRPISDARVVKRVLRGHRDEFGVLVTRYIRLAEAVALAQLGNAADAEDAAQEAIVRAFERLDTLDDPRRFSSWLFTIVRNLCMDHHRSQTRRKELIDNLYPLPPVETPSPERRELYGVLREQVDKLEASHREILLMYYFAEASAKQISSLLGISQEAVRKRLQRAREILGEQMLSQIQPTPEIRRAETRRIARIIAIIAVLPVAWEAAAALSIGGSAVLLRGGLAATVLLLAGGALWLQFRSSWSHPLPAPAPTQQMAPAEISSGDAAKSIAAGGPEGSADASPVASGASFTGRLREEATGAAISDADIAYASRADVDAGSPEWKLLQTNAAGAFDSGFLPPGVYVLRVAAAWGYSDTALQPQVEVALAPDSVTPVELHLKAGTSISGHVVDSTGNPVSGARVDAIPEDPKLPRNAVKTRDDGAFMLFGYESGDSLYLQARRRGMASPPLGPFAAGETEIVLPIAPTLKLSGLLVDSAGRHLPNLPVQACPLVNSSYISQEVTLSGPDGRFDLEGLWPGEFALLVPDMADQPRYDVIEPRRIVLAAEADEVFKVVLSRLDDRAITGRVVDHGGKAIPGARVHVSLAESDARSSLAQATGAFSVESIPAGEHPVLVSAEGFFDLEETVAAGASGLEFRMSPLDTVPVQVVDMQSGAPISEFELGVCRGLRENPWTLPVAGMLAVSSAEGRHDARLLGEGMNTVYVWAEGHAIAMGSVEYRNRRAEPPQLNLGLAPERLIGGQVLDAEGRPMPGVKVYLGGHPAPEASADARAISDGEGRFLVHHAAADTPLLVLCARGFGPAWLPLDSYQHWEGLTLTMEPEATLQGRLAQAPSGDVLLNVRYTEANFLHGEAVALGGRSAFELGGLAPQTATLLLIRHSEGAATEQVLGEIDLQAGRTTSVTINAEKSALVEWEIL